MTPTYGAGPMTDDLRPAFTELLPLGPDDTPVPAPHHRRRGARSRPPAAPFLEVEPEALTLLARTAFHDIAHWLRPAPPRSSCAASSTTPRRRPTTASSPSTC